MSVIRISKVTKELNVGLSTIIKFLQSKGYFVEEDPNAKITEEEYLLLVQAFDKDRYVKLASKRLSQERFYKEKKIGNEKQIHEKSQLIEEVKIEIPEESKPRVVITGKIDLNVWGKKKPIHAIEIEKEKSEEMVISEKIEETLEEDSAVVPIMKEEEMYQIGNKISLEQTENIEKIVLEDIPGMEVGEENGKTEKLKEEEHIVSDKQGLFRLSTSSVPSINFTVTGKIDLNSINSVTRPKRKTKEEKRKEREERNKKQKEVQQQVLQTKQQNISSPLSESSEKKQKKKKRSRIKREKIDIERNIPTTSKNIRSESKKLAHKEISEEDIQKQVKETLAKLTGTSLKKGTKYRKEKREAISQRQDEQNKIEAQEKKVIKITEFVTANDLANMMNVPVNQIISTCMSIDLIVSINQRLDAETINLVADEFGYQTEYVSAEVIESITEEVDGKGDWIPRPPIVTVMGHVDHGKTSLLDNIRNTNVIGGEAGGITQHIGAYHVQLANGRKITFLDTPGHEAFTAMRARGAKVTDIAIIIVAADDNVMPQTIEAINHAEVAGVPIVFAINKIDKPGANPEKIKETLSSMNYLVEEWGGKYQSQNISAKQGIGVQELLEKVLLEAELLELKANPTKRAIGSIIESSLDKGRGYVATVLIRNGTLKIGDIVLSGTNFGRVKAMFNERSQRIERAMPSEPVLVLGLNGAPQSGDTIRVMISEQEAREIALKREHLQREQGLRTQRLLTLDDISKRIAVGNFQQLNVVVKGDVDGSIEALADALIRLSTEQIQIRVIHKGVGQISESDVILAVASNAFIIGFQVRPSHAARKSAEKEGVDIRLYSVIYHAIEDVKSAMSGMLAPEIKEEITAIVEVLEVFKVTKIGSVAGCIVKEGKIKQGDKVRLIREGVVIYSGELGSLKRFKDDVKEVVHGYECGLNIRSFNDIKVGDIAESFREIEVKKTF